MLGYRRSFLKLFLLLSISGGIFAKIVPTKSGDCYSNTTNPYLYFATKTSYFQTDNEETDPIQIEGNPIVFL
jgi:hypothetical protein